MLDPDRITTKALRLMFVFTSIFAVAASAYRCIALAEA